MLAFFFCEVRQSCQSRQGEACSGGWVGGVRVGGGPGDRAETVQQDSPGLVS